MNSTPCRCRIISFGALPYFLSTLFETVTGLTTFQTGLAFLVPSFAIVAGTQAGDRLTVDDIRLAFWLAAGGIIVSLLAALTLPSNASGTGL